MTREELAASIAGYVETHKNYDNMSKRDVAITTVHLFLDNEYAYRELVDVRLDASHE